MNIFLTSLTGKNTFWSLITALAPAALWPDEWPLFLAIFLGLIAGTLASWVWEDQSGIKLPKRWLLWQLGNWGLISILVLAVESSTGLSVKMSMAMAAILSWLGRDGLKRIRKGSLNRIEGMTEEKE